MTTTRRFYFLSVLTVLALSAYPLINGVRMTYISLTQGVLEPEQYAKYVVPYSAICVALLIFTACQPLFSKLKRFALPSGLACAYAIFLVVERFFETMRVRVEDMTLMDPNTLEPSTDGVAATVDIWQAALCITSPEMLNQSLTYTYQDSYFYVIDNGAYKIHYYLISVLLITMVCALAHGIRAMLKDDAAPKQPIFLRSMSTAGLVSLCVFANTTAFFRNTGFVQTPLASILTGLFFVVLGVSVGVYIGSFFNHGRLLGIGLPALGALCVTVFMYVGEALMMGGHLYRFGTGWFFSPLARVVVAPVDLLIILASGGLTWMILHLAHRSSTWPGKKTLIATLACCVAIGVSGPAIAMATPESENLDVIGLYVFDENMYTNPLSSMAFGGTPYVYGFDRDRFILANTASGEVLSYAIEYQKTPVSVDEFSKLDSFGESSSFKKPNLSGFKQRYLLAVISDSIEVRYGLYLMDDEIWLTEMRGTWLWTVHRLARTDATTFEDLERAKQHYESTSDYDPSLETYENHMTLKDVYALARKGSGVTLEDLEPFAYQLTGMDFTVRNYTVTSADTVFVHVRDDQLESILLLSRRTSSIADAMDLREGFQVVNAYLSPSHSFQDVRIVRGEGRGGEFELLFEDDYFMSQCRYYVNVDVAETYAVFSHDELMTVSQALQDRRLTIEDVRAGGLSEIVMVPIDNPLGGAFRLLHHRHTFSVNGERFFPSKSFMYDSSDGAVYYDIQELAQLLEYYGYITDAGSFLSAFNPLDMTSIVGGNYVQADTLARAGIETEIDQYSSVETPVWFTIR